MRTTDALHYPDDGEKNPGIEESRELDRLYYSTMEEYFRRLPRMALSKCPLCKAPLYRAFDPFGIDGPWWWTDRLAKCDEPPHCGHFRVMLGALDIHGRDVPEIREGIYPGPQVPFVVPRLLRLPGMVAVLGTLELKTGDRAYPIAYFSSKKIPEGELHQEWGRQEHWFHNENGQSCWTICNDPYDFDLPAYARKGQLRFVDGAGTGDVNFSDPKKATRFFGLPGDHEPQMMSWGERALGERPNGELICPFED